MFVFNIMLLYVFLLQKRRGRLKIWARARACGWQYKQGVVLFWRQRLSHVLLKRHREEASIQRRLILYLNIINRSVLIKHKLLCTADLWAHISSDLGRTPPHLWVCVRLCCSRDEIDFLHKSFQHFYFSSLSGAVWKRSSSWRFQHTAPEQSQHAPSACFRTWTVFIFFCFY